MDEDVRLERPVRLQGEAGVLEGSLLISPRQRTLDQLNLSERSFVTLHHVRVVRGDWTLGGGPLTFNKAMILFLQETNPPPPQRDRSFGQFTQAPVCFRIAEFEVRGFVHVPPGGEPMKRLEQNKHPFISLTSVLVTGPGTDFSVPFLAVNRERVVAAQQLVLPASATVDAAASIPAE